MKKTKTKLLTAVFVFIILCTGTAYGAFSEPSMAQYTCFPIFQVNAVEPSILIILDNSSSMNEIAYPDPYDHNTVYYGYFEPYVRYSYASSLFTRDPSGDWDGNFLNWASMRRIDVSRKVLMGGLATSRTGGGNQTNIGDSGSGVWVDQETYWDNVPVDCGLYESDSDPAAVPGTSRLVWCQLDGGEFRMWHYDGAAWIDEGLFTIRVAKDITYPDEASNFVDGNLAGVLQKVGSRARWGNEFFNAGNGNNGSGGRIVSPVGTNMTSLVTDLQNTACDTYTPLAEAYYVAMQYFRQLPVEPGVADYANSVVPCANDGDDPFWDGAENIECQKTFVILLTDGVSTMDAEIPAAYKDYADAYDTFLASNTTVCQEYDASDAIPPYDGTDCDFLASGSDYLKDLALWARTNDLRAVDSGQSEALAGEQNLYLYSIYAFGTDPNARNLLKEASKNGGFEDRNSNDVPDLQSEWDEDGDGDPDTYYEASNGHELEAKLLSAINDILERAASGTSVSVLATKGQGEGNLVQAYFRPKVTVGTEDIDWLGFLQSLWVDAYGNMREDTDQDSALDVTVDKIVSYFLDPGTGDTKIRRYDVSPADPYPDLNIATYEELELEDILPVWEAGSRLAERNADDRKIFTYIDKDEDDFVDSMTDGVLDSNPFNAQGEAVSLDTGSAAVIAPYLGVQDGTTWGYLGANHSDRVNNLIQWIRGNNISGLRNRMADWDGDGDEEVWKLGDIVHSTPVSIAKPVDRYNILYSDESYQYYYNAYKNRETVIYVGANDGMLHAFTSYRYDRFSDSYVWPSVGTEIIGDELWGYVPQSLLPHLKWLPDTGYTHAYYVDMKPKIFDAKILDDDIHYADPDSEFNGLDDDRDGIIDEPGDADNWGTFLLVGFNLGGGDISAQEDFDYNAGTADELRTFSPTYVCMDITEPRWPRLLWERSYQDLGRTVSTPAVVKVNEKWFAVFGSGPDDCDGSVSQSGKVYVVDLKTGDAYPDSSFAFGTTDGWLFETGESDAFMSSAASIDKNMNYNVDGTYIGESYQNPSGSWAGKMYKIAIPWIGVGASAVYGETGGALEAYTDDNPNNGQYDYGEAFVDANGNGKWDDGSHEGYYVDDPNDAANPWVFNSLFDSPSPITAPPALSVDGHQNTWIYFGTGRYLNTADKTDTTTQYIFGLKDPFFNNAHQLTGHFADDYYHIYTSSLELDTLDLLNADDYLIANRYEVYDGAALISDENGNGHEGEFDDLKTRSLLMDGWMRTLDTTKERVITKPAILGGTLLISSFVPNDDVCGYGGGNGTFGLQYVTRTAHF